MSSVSTPSATTGSGVLSLEHICSIDDIFHRSLLSFLSCQEVGRMEQLSAGFRKLFQQDGTANGWKILCERDFVATTTKGNTNVSQGTKWVGAAPSYNPDTKGFDILEQQETWKECYRLWTEWNHWTAGGILAPHMIESIQLWTQLKHLLKNQYQLENILQSLAPCPNRTTFQQLVKEKRLPSSLLAFYAVHGGQVRLSVQSQDSEFFAGLFGSYSCYDQFYSMRLLDISDFVDILDPFGPDDPLTPSRGVLIGISPGNPRMVLYIHPSSSSVAATTSSASPSTTAVSASSSGNTRTKDEGCLSMVRRNRMGHTEDAHAIVGRNGILGYIRDYIQKLENGIFQPSLIVGTSPTSRGIGLFPQGGEQMSCCVTQGIEVRASGRWFPDSGGGTMGMNFGYSIRIRMVEEQPNFRTCQLVGRHWEFRDGHGTVRRVDGDAVVGKQPLFFMEENNDENGTTSGNPSDAMMSTSRKSGYVDLGPAGDLQTYHNQIFVYQSQSGSVSGTTTTDTRLAQVQGTFSFLPGSIENPTGPLFHVTVAPFPLTVSFPFY